MDDRRIRDALRKATDTQQVVIGERALDSVADVFERSFEEDAAVVVADENTFHVAGATVSRRIEASGREVIEPFVFPGRPTLHADHENIERLSAERFRATYRRAQMIRRRYTVLDLADESEVLDECVQELFAGDGFWAASR
jgi:glycerol dehydrogenase-like iron-containing ADH family enzyme